MKSCDTTEFLMLAKIFFNPEFSRKTLGKRERKGDPSLNSIIFF